MTRIGTEHPLILVVDDDPLVLDEVQQLLANAELSCYCCTNSDEAIQAVQMATPALILCDVNLGGASGAELCEQLKQQPGLGNVPLMFLSNMQSPDVIRRRCGARGSYCLRKPLDHTVLLELIEQAIGVSAASCR